MKNSGGFFCILNMLRGGKSVVFLIMLYTLEDSSKGLTTIN